MKPEKLTELHCVFTFHGVLQRIFKIQADAESFKKAYCPAGYIKPYDLQTCFDAVLISKDVVK
jgi:hypothetical protein